jgi:predicted transcriptional regulator
MARRSVQLGDLERAILDRLWTQGPADVRAMHDAVGSARGIAPNTVQSTLERLVRKGLAERRKTGRAYSYRARVTRREWVAAALEAWLDALPGDDADLWLAAFVDRVERTGADQLDALERLVRDRRRGRSEDGP